MLLYLLTLNKTLNLEYLLDDFNIDIFSNIISHNLLTNKTHLFNQACIKGQLLLSQLLYDKLTDNTFEMVCTRNHLSVAKWLYSLDSSIITSDIKYTFCRVCENGYLDMAKWLYSISLIDIHILDEYPFRWASANGHYDIVIWLNSISPVNMSSCENFAFYCACLNGYLEIAKFIKSNTIVDVQMDNNYCFLSACINGYMNMVQWLIECDPDILFNVNLSYIFMRVCYNDHPDIALWLCTLDDSYTITIIDGHIHDFSIGKSLNMALKKLQDNKYNETLHYMHIKNKDMVLSDNTCYICHDIKQNLIYLPCHHTFCLECLLQWFITIDKSHDFKCMYCQQIFKWEECYSITAT